MATTNSIMIFLQIIAKGDGVQLFYNSHSLKKKKDISMHTFHWHQQSFPITGINNDVILFLFYLWLSIVEFDIWCGLIAQHNILILNNQLSKSKMDFQ